MSLVLILTEMLKEFISSNFFQFDVKSKVMEEPVSVTMCSALDSVEIIEYSNELWDYPGWNHEVDIKVFPVEVNLLIREYVACMLLSEKLEWELAKDSKNTSLQRES